MLKLKSAILLFSFILSVNFSLSYGVNTSANIDEFLKSIDLQKLVDTNKAVSLYAQMNDPHTSGGSVNDFSRFIAIGVIEGSTTVATQFDYNQTIIQKISYPEAWVGVSEFDPKELPALSLQEGLELAKRCMIEKGHVVSDRIRQAIIYKTVRADQFVYDYVLEDAKLPADICQEILYTPETGECQKGSIINCHYEMPTAIKKIK